MKKKSILVSAGLIAVLLTVTNSVALGQSDNDVIKKYLTVLPHVRVNVSPQKYRMTATYINRDLYGNFTDKNRITGEYTKATKGDSCIWNNVYLSSSSRFEDSFPSGTRQDFIEGFKYIPSPDMVLKPGSFTGFPPTPDAVYSKNLIWDMMAFETFAFTNHDSLKLNKSYDIPDSGNEFNMGDIGTYEHSGISLCWTGISALRDKLCAVIEFRAIDNKVGLSMEAVKTKGTEQYWGTIWISLSDSMIEKAEMYSGTIQEITMTGMENKFLVKTIRELTVEKIQ